MTCRPPISFTTMSCRNTSTRLLGAACRICGNISSRSNSAVRNAFFGLVMSMMSTSLFAVHDDGVGLVAGIPREHAVDLVRGLLALAVDREVADTLGQRRPVLRIRHVV